MANGQSVFLVFTIVQVLGFTIFVSESKSRSAASAPAAANSQVGVTRRVLVVENEQAIRDLLSKTLKLADYGVDTVPDGEDAMEQLTSKTYDLLIVGRWLPDMDTGVLIQHVKGNQGL